MGIFDAIKEVVTQKPVHLKKPDFYKADSDARKQLERLRELQNSYLPIIVLHDLRLEHGGLSAQIDYLIITTKFCLIVECKNLFGNLEVNSRGEFIRELDFNGKRKKEGIYSPVTQNVRHMEMIKVLRLANKKNPLMRAALEKSFGDFHRSVIVLANPKTVINLKRAPKAVKDQIIRGDQLIAHIKKLLRENKDWASSEKEMYEMAEFFVGLHKENTLDYAAKYFSSDCGEVSDEGVEVLPDQAEIDITKTPLYKALKQYRYETSRAEGIKPYYVYSNLQLEAVIAAMPANLDELKKISGFGDVKCEKYGEAILGVVAKHRETGS